MKKEIILTAKTVEEAIENAVKELGAPSAEVLQYMVLEEPKKGLFGIGAAPAKVSFVYETEKTGGDIALEFIQRLLSDMEINADVTMTDGDNDDKVISVVGEEAGILIGHHGDTLDSLQYLANLAANKKINGVKAAHVKISVDAEGYRAKREETLRALARRMAQKALRNRRSVMLEPMSAYERRIIHSEIQNIEGVSTNSIGSDNNRKIVIFLTDKKPQGIFEEEKTTPLAEEFAPVEDEVRIDDVDESVVADAEENETETVKQTYPDESENYADTIDDSDIK